MQIAIGLPIGYQAGAGGAVGVFDYLVNDTFSTDRAAGAINGTPAEPGPGDRLATDTNSKLTISGGSLAAATGGVGAGNPGLAFEQAVARVPGRILLGKSIVHTSQGIEIGFGISTTDRTTSVRVSTTTAQIRSDGAVLAVGTFTFGQTYHCAVLLRANGSFYFVKGGAYTHWTLLFISAGNNTSPLFIIAHVTGSTSVVTVGELALPAERWLPTPLISDGFSVAGTSDGLGHDEGITGGFGAGGSGVSWTANLGTWTVSGGLLVPTAVGVSPAVAILLADCGKADMLASVRIYSIAGGSTSLIVRWVDISNHIVIRHSGTNVQLIKVVGGSATTLVNVAATYVDGAVIRLIVQGTKFRCYYNDAFIGSEQTISDAGLQASTTVGLIADNLATRFDDFTVYARGSGGEYNSVLDNL